jgi:hypothetical protein
MERSSRGRFVAAAVSLATVFLGSASALLSTCGPFTDVAADSFCPFVLEFFYLGITTGTTPTTYDPGGNVSRLQMAAFLSRSVDRVLLRGSRRAATAEFWTPQGAWSVGVTTLGWSQPAMLRSDGADVWVACSGDGFGDGAVVRVRASDGKLLQTWTGATSASGLLVAMGRIFSAGFSPAGRLYQIDPGQPAGAVTTVASNLGNAPVNLVFDGARIWTSNFGSSVSIVTPGPSIPWTTTTVTTGFSIAYGALFDGNNVWVVDPAVGTLLRLGVNGEILQTVTVGSGSGNPTFDGSNIWVPNFGPPASVSVVRASSGTVLETLTGNGLAAPFSAAFDGQRILITNHGATTASLWKAASLAPLGDFSLPDFGHGACSDGARFWIGLVNTGQLVRF